MHMTKATEAKPHILETALPPARKEPYSRAAVEELKELIRKNKALIDAQEDAYVR